MHFPRRLPQLRDDRDLFDSRVDRATRRKRTKGGCWANYSSACSHAVRVPLSETKRTRIQPDKDKRKRQREGEERKGEERCRRERGKYLISNIKVRGIGYANGESDPHVWALLPSPPSHTYSEPVRDTTIHANANQSTSQRLHLRASGARLSSFYQHDLSSVAV